MTTECTQGREMQLKAPKDAAWKKVKMLLFKLIFQLIRRNYILTYTTTKQCAITIY